MDFANLNSPLISGSDVFLDGSLPFPEVSSTITTSIFPDVTTAGSSSSVIVQTQSGSDRHTGNGIPTLSTVTHTFLDQSIPQVLRVPYQELLVLV